ncbi:MAG: glycerophosphodiester phosphodiesterase [Aquihabitans sp.]
MSGLVILASVLVACSGGDDTTRPAAPNSTSGEGTSTTAARSTSSAPAVEPLGPYAAVIAHRGASAHAPEHTFAAYDLALSQGADYIEQDIQLTSDGELVVLHDDTLDRTARGPAESCTGSVRTKTLAQVRACDMGSWFNEANPELANPDFAGQRIATMRAVFDRYGSKVRYYIETKAPEEQPGLEQALLDLLGDVGYGGPAAGSGRVIIQSFSIQSLEMVHQKAPNLPLVLLLRANNGPIPAGVLDAAARYAFGIGPFVANADAALIDAAHQRCLAVHVWTVDDPAVMSPLIRAGVDGMFTNNPDVMGTERTTGRVPDHCVRPATGR